jgi:hypothetical protein
MFYKLFGFDIFTPISQQEPNKKIPAKDRMKDLINEKINESNYLTEADLAEIYELILKIESISKFNKEF